MDIKIDIDDERHFVDVAPVVDRDDFAREVNRIRSVLGLKIPLSDNDYSQPPTKAEEELIETEIEKSRNLLYLPVVFKSVIASVVFSNEVTNNDYSPAYLECTWGSFNDEGVTPDETYSIVLSPGVRDVDVLKALQKYRDQLGNEKGVGKYQYIHQIWEISKNKPSLRKFRKWYIAVKSGKSFADIAEQETKQCLLPDGHVTGKKKSKKCTCYDESTIRKGVSSYEFLLGKARTL